jgi:hypothetical protein
MVVTLQFGRGRESDAPGCCRGITQMRHLSFRQTEAHSASIFTPRTNFRTLATVDGATRASLVHGLAVAGPDRFRPILFRLRKVEKRGKPSTNPSKNIGQMKRHESDQHDGQRRKGHVLTAKLPVIKVETTANRLLHNSNNSVT